MSRATDAIRVAADNLRVAADELDAEHAATAAAAVPVITAPASTATEKPGNPQVNTGDGTLPPIESIHAVPANGTVRIGGSGIRAGSNVALVSPSGAHDRGYALEVAPDGSWAVASGVDLGEPGGWQARLIDPVTYATSPWFGFTVVL